MEISATLGSMYSMESKIVIFEGNQSDGIFSISKKFYEPGLSKKERDNRFREARIKLGKKYGFNGLHMFQQRQKMTDNKAYKDNRYVVITNKYMDKEDYFDKVIKADILMITKDYPGVALCHKTADCPILIAEDRRLGVTALTHTGIYHINRGLPKALIESLIKEFNSNPKDIYLYIGSHIKKDSYVYNNYPAKATNKEIWKNAITESNGKYYIDLEQAILNQLENYDLGGIEISKNDTATTPGFASHSQFYKNNKSKKGQNIVGFYYK